VINSIKYNDLFQKSIKLFQSGKFSESELICTKLIQINSKNSDVYNLLSLIKDKNGEADLAIKNIKIAISLQPNNYLYLNNLSDFYRKQKQFDKAIEALEKSIKLNPNIHIPFYMLGNIYKEIGNNIKAKELYDQSIRLNFNDYMSLNNLGLISLDNNEFKKSREYFVRAMNINPDDIDIKFNNISTYLVEQNYYGVEFWLRDLLKKDPVNTRALKQLSEVLLLDGRLDDFREIYQLYLDNSYANFEEINNIKHIRKIIATDYIDTSNFQIDFQRKNIISEIENTDPFINKNLIGILDIEQLNFDMQFAYHGRDNKELKYKYNNLFNKYFTNKDLTFNTNKIKIGFLITKIHENIFLRFLFNIISSLPNDQFDIYIICSKSGWEKTLKNKLKEFTKQVFIDTDIEDSAKIILDLRLDILYHWEIGTDTKNYFLPFYRLAPIQCTSIGWPDTSAIETVDYFISSDLIETENAQENYTEKLIKFKKLPFNIDNPKVISNDKIKQLQHFNFESDKNIYLCNQNLRKIHPDFDILVSGILKKDPNGIIVFVETKNKNISELLKLRIRIKHPDIYNQLIFLEHLNNEEYLSLLTHAKVILDTLYFGGANTSYEAFAMNAPIVTFPWTHERGRYTLGCYKQMDIDGLVANSFDEYIDLAVKTANDKEFRDKIVKDISENNHKLFNDKEVVQEYVNFFQSVARPK